MSRSPHVSQPRRRLPTVEISASGACSRSVGDAGRPRRRALGHQAPARGALALFERLEDEGLLLRAHPLERADASLARRALEVVERADPELAVEHRDRLRPDALEPEEVEDRGGKLLRAAPGDTAGARVDELADLRGEVLADAGDAEPFGRSSAGDRSPRWAIVSDALRYARILNGFSLLISRRSAISASMRAMARLSTRAHRRRRACRASTRLDRKIEQAPPRLRARHESPAVRFTDAEQAPAAVPRRRPCPPAPALSAAASVVDLRRRDARRELLAVLPLVGDVPRPPPAPDARAPRAWPMAMSWTPRRRMYLAPPSCWCRVPRTRSCRRAPAAARVLGRHRQRDATPSTPRPSTAGAPPGIVRTPEGTSTCIDFAMCRRSGARLVGSQWRARDRELGRTFRDVPATGRRRESQLESFDLEVVRAVSSRARLSRSCDQCSIRLTRRPASSETMTMRIDAARGRQCACRFASSDVMSAVRVAAMAQMLESTVQPLFVGADAITPGELASIIIEACRFARFVVTSVSSRSPGSPATRSLPICALLAREFDLGGIILFARNVDRARTGRRLAREAQALAQELPLWVSVDQEGGRVARLKSPFTVWPPMATLGRSGDERAGRAVRARARGRAQGGRHLDGLHAGPRHPHEPENPVIGDRALAERADDVARLGPAIIRTLQAEGIAACGKHFPGHGDTQRRLAPRAAARSSIRPTGSRRSSSCRSARPSRPASRRS